MRKRLSIALCSMLAMLVAPLLCGAISTPTQLRGKVVDENGVPVPGAQIILQLDGEKRQTAYSDEAGRFELTLPASGKCTVSLSKPGFFLLANQTLDVQETANEITFTLNHEVEVHETIEVVSSASRIDPQETAHETGLVAREIRDIPVPSSHDVRNSLPVLPAVVRDNFGQIHVAGARSGQAEFLLDGFEIGNPATGELTMRVNVDSVRALTVETGRYGAQYAHAGAGVVALDTAAGDDRWRFGTTNFFPDLNFERGVHFGNWYPRVTFSGPLRKGRAWFSEAVSLQRSFDLVREQPRGADTSTQWGGDNLLRAQVNLTPANALQGSFLFNTYSAGHLGLGPFAPLSTTVDAGVRRYFVSAKDQISLKRAVIEIGAAYENRSADISPMGSAPYVVGPSSVAGNFFEAHSQHVRRGQFIGSVILPSRHWLGSHDLQMGMNLADTAFRQSAVRNAIEYLRGDATLSLRALFTGPTQFRLTNTQWGAYGQDSWKIARALLVQIGLRADWDRMLSRTMIEPRAAANIIPFRDERTKITLAWGLYYQPVDLSLWGQTLDQRQGDEFLDPSGSVVVLGPVEHKFVLASSRLKQPRFRTASAEWTQKLWKRTLAGIHFIHRNEHEGLGFEPMRLPAVIGGPGNFRVEYRLSNARRDTYRAAEFWLRHDFGEKAEVFASFSRSHSRSNQALDFALGDIVYASQSPGPLVWDTPNRLVSWGWAPAPFWKLWLSYFLEYRTGFPFDVLNQERELVGAPGSLRFPDYFSLNVGIEKRFRVKHHEWAARLSIINITDRENHGAVVNNVDAPNFLTFAGGQRRALTGRLRLVGRK